MTDQVQDGRLNLVTGGAGFIGRHLVRLLLERGERVRVLDILRPDDVDPAVEFMQGSVTDPETVDAALAGAARLYHLAGNPNLWARPKSTFDDNNHFGTAVVMQRAARANLDRIVYTSTESILKSYKQRLGGGLIDESVQLSADDMPGPYCRSKFLAEQEAMAAARRGLPVVIVNPTLPVGPGDRLLTPPTAMILGFLRGDHPAYLDCQLNMIDVRDVAAGHVLAADKGRVGERYILGNTNLSLGALLQLIQDIAGVPVPRWRTPYWVAWCTAVVSEFLADMVTHRPPVAPLTGVRLAGTPMVFDCSKAVGELGLPQTPLRRSLVDVIEWLRAEGLAPCPVPASTRASSRLTES